LPITPRELGKLISTQNETSELAHLQACYKADRKRNPLTDLTKFQREDMHSFMNVQNFVYRG
jgi:hypothetical protein